MGSPPILASSAPKKICKQRGRPVNVLSNAVGLSMLRFASGDTAWLQIEMTVTLIGASLVQIKLNIYRPPASSAVTEVNIDEGRWTSEPRSTSASVHFQKQNSEMHKPIRVCGSWLKRVACLMALFAMDGHLLAIYTMHDVPPNTKRIHGSGTPACNTLY